MNILIDDSDNWLDRHPNILTIIEEVVKTTLIEEEFSMDAEISLTLTDNKTIKTINFAL